MCGVLQCQILSLPTLLTTVLKNFLRGALLAFFATFLGVFLFFTFPDMVTGTLLRRPMPFWFYENEVRTLPTRPKLRTYACGQACSEAGLHCNR